MRVNGETVALPSGSTVEGVVKLLAQTEAGIAVALNGEVVPKSGWSLIEVHAGDHLEVLSAAAGG